MSADDRDEHAPPVVVATYLDRGEAEVGKAHLASHGIVASIIDEVEGGLIPVNTESGVALVVQHKDAARAAQALEAR